MRVGQFFVLVLVGAVVEVFLAFPLDLVVGEEGVPDFEDAGLLLVVDVLVNEERKGPFPHVALPVFRALFSALGPAFDLVQQEVAEGLDLPVLLQFAHVPRHYLNVLRVLYQLLVLALHVVRYVPRLRHAQLVLQKLPRVVLQKVVVYRILEVLV